LPGGLHRTCALSDSRLLYPHAPSGAAFALPSMDIPAGCVASLRATTVALSAYGQCVRFRYSHPLPVPTLSRPDGWLGYLVQAPDLALRVSRYGWKLACPFRWACPVCAALRFRWLAAVAAVALTIPIGPEPFKHCNTVNSYSVMSLRSNGRNVEDSLGPEGPTRGTCKRVHCEAEPDRQAR